MTTETELTISIAASPATIFPYLVDQNRFVEWMGTSVELDPVDGGALSILCGGVNPAAGQFLEIVEDQKVRFTFGWDLPDHPIPKGSTEVEITLTPAGSNTIVRLIHRGLPDDAISDHRSGWTYYLERLNVVATGGNAGPDRAGQQNQLSSEDATSDIN